MARLINSDALHRKVMMETNPYGKPTIDYDSGVKVLEWIDKAPTVDAVPVSELKKLRDYLYAEDLIFMRGLAELNKLIAKHGGTKAGKMPDKNIKP